ncbi:MAG: hypothetical protein AAF572_27730 [Cyanobacteria bacterium P01_B01_bin.77]
MSYLNINGSDQIADSFGHQISNDFEFLGSHSVLAKPPLENSNGKGIIGSVNLTDEFVVEQIKEFEAQLGLSKSARVTMDGGSLPVSNVEVLNAPFSLSAPFSTNVLKNSLEKNSAQGSALEEDVVTGFVGVNATSPLGDSLLNASQIGDVLSEFLGSVDNSFTGIAAEINVPLVGKIIDDISTGSLDFSNLGDTLVQKLTEDGVAISANAITQKISTIPGLSASVLSESQEQVNFSLDFQEFITRDFPLFPQGLGLSNIFQVPDELSTTVTLGVSYSFNNLEFGVSSSGAFVDKSDATLDIGINLDLPDSGIDDLKLGLLNVDLREPANGNDFELDISVNLEDFSYEFLYSKLNTVDLFEFDVGIPDGLTNVPGIGDIKFEFPEISGGIQLDFNALGDNADLDSGYPFKISDITLDIGSLNNFIGPFLNPVHELIQPLREVADILYAPVPILNDLASEIPEILNAIDRGGNINGNVEISLRDILAIAAEIEKIDVNFEFFDQGLQVIGLLDDLQISNGLLNLGDLNYYQGVFSEQQNQSVGSVIDSDLPEGFNSSLLEDPVSSVFGLLLSNGPLDLITYSTPQFEFEGTVDQIIPILGPLGVSVGGRFDVEAQFSFGFDTNGLDTGFLEDGFYIADVVNGEDVREVQFLIGPRVGPGLEFGAASLSVFAGYGGGISLDFNDDDGKLRLSELGDRVASRPFELFDVPIDLEAGFGGQFSLAGITLFRPEINGNIQIAEISGSEIQNTADQLLSAGNKAADFISDIYQIFATGDGFTQTLDFARYLFSETSAGFEDIGKILANAVNISTEDITRILWELGLRDINEIARILIDSAGRALEDVADAFVQANDILNQGVRDLAQVFEGFAVDATDLANALAGGAGFIGEEIADVFNDFLGFDATTIANALWGNGIDLNGDLPGLGGPRELTRILNDEIPDLSADDFGKALFNGAGFTVETIADALDDGLGKSATFIADALWTPGIDLNGALAGLGNDRDLGRLLNVEIPNLSADDFGRALFNGADRTAERIADILDDGLGKSATFIADALWDSGVDLNGALAGLGNSRNLASLLNAEIPSISADDFGRALFRGAGLSSSVIADALDDGLGKSATFIADALWDSGVDLNGTLAGLGNNVDITRILRNEGISTERITDGLSFIGFSPSLISSSFSRIGINISVGSVNSYLGGAINTIASNVSSVGRDITNFFGL